MGSRKKPILTDSSLSMRLYELDELVNELTCDKPNSQILREQMKKFDIEYSENRVECMSRVLLLIQKIQFDFNQDLPEFQASKNLRGKKVGKDGIEI